jgi:outer membrane protein assembly factor BamD (BamD/ComL family)
MMTRKLLPLLISVFFLTGAQAEVKPAERSVAAEKSKKKSTKPKSTKAATASKPAKSGGGVVARIKELATTGQYQEASKLLFSLSRSPKNASEAAQLKYMLGLMLMELKLYQVASFVFYDVIDEEIRRGGEGRYLRQSLGKLSYLSNVLDSDVLLKYAVSRIQINQFPAESRDLFFYRYGELKLKEGSFEEAARAFSKVEPDSAVYPQALYKQGLSYAENNQLNKATYTFEELLNRYQSKPVTDTNRVNANLGLARLYYQSKKWDTSLNYYRQIPRDTLQWHDALFEMSWAMMMAGQFRSASSNFHTLHSPYYETQYAPESLLLRAIVYLYICRYDEMEKVLELFDRIYKPVMANASQMLDRSDDSRIYWDEVKKSIDERKNKKDKKTFKRLNDITMSSILKQSLIRSNVHYYEMLVAENQLIAKMSPGWQQSALGKFGKRIIERRRASTQDLVGKLTRNHLLKMKSELRDFFEQNDFLKLEMLGGKKEVVAKEISGRKIQRKQITDDASRNFFIANGYEYWPFQGEYWLDELGNYHYVGVQACE